MVTDEILATLNKTHLISSNVLAENEVHTSVNVTGELLRLYVPSSLLQTLSWVNFTMKSNQLLSSFRTNYDARPNSVYISKKHLY
jgi:hypothetical protein